MTLAELVEFVTESRSRRNAALMAETVWIHPVHSELIQHFKVPGVFIAAATVIPKTTLRVPPHGGLLILSGHWRSHAEQWTSDTGMARRFAMPIGLAM